MRVAGEDVVDAERLEAAKNGNTSAALPAVSVSE